MVPTVLVILLGLPCRRPWGIAKRCPRRPSGDDAPPATGPGAAGDSTHVAQKRTKPWEDHGGNGGDMGDFIGIYGDSWGYLVGGAVSPS